MKINQSFINGTTVLGTSLALFGIGQAAVTNGWKIALEICSIIYFIFAILAFLSKNE